MSGFPPDHPGAEIRVSPNFTPRRGTDRPDMIILHYTGMATGEAAEAWLCDPASEVSSHYLVHEDGRIVQMVRESDRAWHAGKSSWRGETDINSWSVGIEIVNPGHTLGYKAFPKRQIEAVIGLCGGIFGRHGIVPERILAHSDVAPGRKVDPGEKFPWRILAQSGVGHFVEPARTRKGLSLKSGDEGVAVEQLQSMLALFGYGIEITGIFDLSTEIVVAAFQRHFRVSRVDGVADPATVETLRRLLSKLPASST
ncbi:MULTISPECIES: N-acetylmuramoyl-L-alanine amidase [unclassified Mesorhizobium]|uniref:N-acetylmuramoyl-L-alanine amidase n=1 Tax=unclassified Mesorhizobium TaxID=325217 RepID=UPI003014AAEB